METKTQVMAMWFDEPVGVGLRRLAGRQGWPVVRPRTVREAVTVVLCRRPRLVVAQLQRERGLDLAVIAMLHRRGQVSLLAVAAEHNLELEMRARAAGAHCYLPADAGAGEVVRMVRLLLERNHGPAPPGNAPVMEGGSDRCMMYF